MARPKTPLDYAIGQRIRSVRRAKRMSMRELAERIGVRQQQIQRYELGLNRISAACIVEIARELEVPVTHILVDEEQTATASPPSDHALFVDGFLRLTGQQQLTVRQWMDEMLCRSASAIERRTASLSR